MKSLPLEDLRVVECGNGVAAAFATKLMALLGAQIIKVEPPEGDDTRFRGPFVGNHADPDASGLFLYLNADKGGVSLDLRLAKDRAKLDELLEDADILVHNVAPRERAALRMESVLIQSAHPHLIVTGISAYGDFGPRSNWRAYELNMIHAGGIAALAPLCSKRPDLPPLKLYGHQAEFQAANHAAPQCEDFGQTRGFCRFSQRIANIVDCLLERAEFELSGDQTRKASLIVCTSHRSRFLFLVDGRGEMRSCNRLARDRVPAAS